VAQTTRHHADQVQATVARGSAATSAMVASWRRSSNFHRLDPAECNLPRRLSQAEFENARQQIEPLVRAAQSNLDRLFLAVGGVGCCVLLADRNGVPVDRRGAACDDKTFKAWGLWTGTVWSEECEGTNGIGTCLAEQRALPVCARYQSRRRRAGRGRCRRPRHRRGWRSALTGISSRSRCRHPTCSAGRPARRGIST